jgi:hypothetical protein
MKVVDNPIIGYAKDSFRMYGYIWNPIIPIEYPFITFVEYRKCDTVNQQMHRDLVGQRFFTPFTPLLN